MTLCQLSKQIFIVFLISLTMVGCRDQAKPPEFDRTRAQLTSLSATLIREEQTDDAINCLTKLLESNPEDPYATAALRKQEIRQLVETANELLRKGHFNELDEHLSNVEAEGDISPELLDFRNAPPALEAMARFCRRMPWETSKDLETNLETLVPHLPVLNQSETFKDFISFQKQQLEALRRSEWQQANLDILTRLDQAIVTQAQQDVEKILRELKAKFPQNPFFRYGSFSTKAEADRLYKDSEGLFAGRLAYELASSYRWNAMPGELKGVVAGQLAGGEGPVSLSGLWRVAEQRKNNADYLKLMARLKGKAPNPDVAKTGITLAKATDPKVFAPIGSANALEVTNVLHQIRLVSTIGNKTNKTNAKEKK